MKTLDIADGSVEKAWIKICKYIKCSKIRENQRKEKKERNRSTESSAPDDCYTATSLDLLNHKLFHLTFLNICFSVKNSVFNSLVEF